MTVFQTILALILNFVLVIGTFIVMASKWAWRKFDPEYVKARKIGKYVEDL